MKTLILFGSSTGNTSDYAQKIKETLYDAGVEADMLDVAEADGLEYGDYDNIIIGCSTWDDGALQSDFDFHMEDLEEDSPNLNGKRFAVFGCGESYYDNFCKAVDILEDKFADFGAEKVQDGLKIDTSGDDTENESSAFAWTKGLAEVIK